MKFNRSGLRAVIAAPLMAIVAACPAKEPAPAPQDLTVTITEANAFLDGWVAAREGGDGAVLTPMYYNKTGFIWIEDGRTMYTAGGDAAAALDFASTGGYTPRVTLGTRAITPLAPNVAAVSAEYTQTFSLGGLNLTTNGMFTGVLVNEDGQWKFVQGHFSAPLDDLPPAPEPVSEPATETVTEPAAEEPAVPN